MVERCHLISFYICM